MATWRWLGVLWCCGAALVAQRWQDTCGRTAAGIVALQQAVRDAGTDALVLLVASHPDDRYVLPAVWLRYRHGARIAVLLATRGGGGQNSSGPETGDALERIRTLETEAGCSHFDGEAWYLNLPDGGYRRSAAETFAEWGEQQSLRDMARLLRTVRPDFVVTTHHEEESHGHDLALVSLLPRAVELAASAEFASDQPPHAVTGLLLGAGSTPGPRVVRVGADRLEPARGLTLRRLAYEVLRQAHTSPGAPAPLDAVFPPDLLLEPRFAAPDDFAEQPLRAARSLFAPELWPGPPARAAAVEQALLVDLPAAVQRGSGVTGLVVPLLAELRGLRAAAGPEALRRLERRIAALEQVLLLASELQVEVEVAPGTVAVPGEEFAAAVRVHCGRPLSLALRAEGRDGVAATLDGLDDAAAGGQGLSAQLLVRLADRGETDLAQRFRADRFVPPVRVRLWVALHGTEVPVDLTLPVEERPPVELTVVPRMLLLPTARQHLEFSVAVARHTQFPVAGELEVRAPAGYALPNDRRSLALREERSQLVGFTVQAPLDRKPGVDVLRVRLGKAKVSLPVHKVDVRIRPDLRVGILRSRDDTLPAVLGAGGLGVAWSELSDADIAVADLGAFDSIVVDVRSLRDRPEARRGFGRLLEFAARPGKRLVVFYHKDVEFQPPGEAFQGAPFQPFLVGRNRVTRPDAPVQVLRRDHVLLREPNRLQAGDWDGWEQERALYLPNVYAGQYEEILAVQDPGQPEERGALLYARTGRGEYVYCALALWRQLKKLHPGAVRLLANLLTPAPPP